MSLESLESSFISSDVKSEEKIQKDEQKQQEKKQETPQKEETQTLTSPKEGEDEGSSHKKRNLSQMNEEKSQTEKKGTFFDSLDDSSINYSDLKSENQNSEDQSPLAKKKPKISESQEEKKSKKEEDVGVSLYMSSFDSPFRSASEKPQAFPFEPLSQSNTFLEQPASPEQPIPFPYSSVVFNRDVLWQEEDKLTLDERRKRYHFSDYVTLEKIQTWNIASNSVNFDSVRSSKYKFNSEINKKIAFYHGDITKLEIDAIVNAANRFLMGGGGVDGAIHKAAGPKLSNECASLDGCPTGEAKITRGYDLPARYVIHTVGPLDENRDQLRSCYTSCLEVALGHNLKTIAFCGISTGIYGFPLETATEVALSTVRNWLEVESNRNKIDLIIFCTFLPKEKDCYAKLAGEYFPVQSITKEASAKVEPQEEQPPSTKIEPQKEQPQSIKVETQKEQPPSTKVEPQKEQTINKNEQKTFETPISKQESLTQKEESIKKDQSVKHQEATKKEEPFQQQTAKPTLQQEMSKKEESKITKEPLQNEAELPIPLKEEKELPHQVPKGSFSVGTFTLFASLGIAMAMGAYFLFLKKR